MKRAVRALGWLFFPGLLASAATHASSRGCDAAFAPGGSVHRQADEMRRSGDIPGLHLIIEGSDGRRRQLLLGRTPGNLGVASASKWVASALAMTYVDQGEVQLESAADAVLGIRKIPGTSPTLRQLLSYTAGQKELRALAEFGLGADLSLAQVARAILRQPAPKPPGTDFAYGGPSFDVVGAMVERVSGRSWHEAFEDRLAEPLGMHESVWLHPKYPDHRYPPHPVLQAGLQTTAEDYMKFLDMIAGHGMVGGRQVLSARAIDLMERDHVQGLPVRFAPPSMTGSVRYGLGLWCEELSRDGRRCSRVSSPGMSGTYPWVDRAARIHGVLFMKVPFRTVAAKVQDLRRGITAACGVSQH